MFLKSRTEGMQTRKRLVFFNDDLLTRNGIKSMTKKLLYWDSYSCHKYILHPPDDIQTPVHTRFCFLPTDK